MRGRAPLLLLLLAGLLPAPASAGGKDPSHVVFPEQKLPIKFSHAQHLQFKLDCDFCHENAPSSVSASDSLSPVEDSCSSCHKIDRDNPLKAAKPPARCDSCHLYEPARPGSSTSPDEVRASRGGINWNEPLRIDIPTPNLKFNHKVHVERDIKCERCHGRLRDVELATRLDLPSMPMCLECHNNLSIARPASSKSTRAPVRCATCHIAQADSTLQTQFASGRMAPSGTLKGDAHTLDFATRHAQVGRDEAAYCESCHRKDFCLACHNGVVKPLAFHGNDYLQIHAIEARKASLNCDSCHRRQTFCLGCHERAGLVVPDPGTTGAPTYLHNARPSPLRFHPQRLINGVDAFVYPPRTADHHSWQAERNLKACASCHREESCIVCHATANVKTLGLPAKQFTVNPHPPGFAGSRQCDSISSRNGRVCLKCHAPDDPHLGCR